MAPKFTETINPPTLLAYYLTLPKWVREHSLITNCFYALEYHQTRTTIRNKELAMNFAASFLRPLDDRMMKVIKEGIASKKLRLNVELGKQMVNERKFWAIDIHEVGEESGDEGNIRKGDDKSMGLDDSDASGLTMAQRMLRFIDEDEREKERRVIMDKEQNISEFMVEPEVESCQIDFYRWPYAEAHDIEAEQKEVEHVQPVNYWDNDDGFWDEYIAHKHKRMESAGFIVNRKFFKH